MNMVIETVLIVALTLGAVSFGAYWIGFNAGRREILARQETARWARRLGDRA